MLKFGARDHSMSFFVDSGADDSFIDEKLVNELHIPTVLLPKSILLQLADGSNSTWLTRRTAPILVKIGAHHELATFFITHLCHAAILGLSWLERHNPTLDWKSKTCEFASNFCLQSCLVEPTKISSLALLTRPE